MDQFESISTLDWLIIGVVVLSSLLSLKRGFVKEVISLLTWIVAFVVAVKFTSPAQTLLTEEVQNDQIRYIVTFVGLFIATLVLGSLVNFVLSSLIQVTGLSGTDRLIGMLFGFVRGSLIVVAFISLLSLSPAIEKMEFWTESQFAPQLVVLKDWVREMLGKGGDVISSSPLSNVL